VVSSVRASLDRTTTVDPAPLVEQSRRRELERRRFDGIVIGRFRRTAYSHVVLL